MIKVLLYSYMQMDKLSILTQLQCYRINRMYTLDKKDAELMLLELLKRTLKNQSDIDELMDLVKTNNSSIPMKGIRHKYDSMDKNTLTKKDQGDLDTLMHFYGP